MLEGEANSCGRTSPQIRENNSDGQTSLTEAPRGAPCPCAVSTPGRRALLAAGVGLGVDLTARVAGAQSDASHARPKEGDLLVKVGDTTPLGPDSLSMGAGQVMSWPMDPADKVVRDGSRLNKVLLVRLDPATLNSQTMGRAADGVVAYSAICPHTGCEVVNWSAERQILECPCHNSRYDPKAGARVIAGPSPRSLAALPLSITNGKLTVARPFVGRLGIQQM